MRRKTLTCKACGRKFEGTKDIRQHQARVHDTRQGKALWASSRRAR